MDGCSSIGYPDYAFAKAKSSIMSMTSSREFRDKYTVEKDPVKISQLNAMVCKYE